MTTRPPETEQRSGEPHTIVDGVGLIIPGQRRPHVALVERHPGQDRRLCRAEECRFEALGRGQERGGVTGAQRRLFTALRQLLGRIFADHLQHREAGQRASGLADLGRCG